MSIKRIFTFVTLIFATVTLNQAAATTFEYEGLKFTTASDGSKNVSLSGGTVENGQLIIPATVNYEGTDYTVNAIAWWAFQSRTDIISVIMPDCISSIGASAFTNCTSLETITWSSGLKSIGQFSFAECSALKSVNLPEGLESIGNDCFFNCTDMTEISLPQTLATIGEAAFAGCDNLVSIDIPAGVAVISRHMISGKNLTHIGLPEGLTRIETMGISTCFALKELRLPYSVTSLAENAIFRCDLLEVVYVSWPRPIPIGEDALDDAVIHVPVNTASYYRQSRNWNMYQFVEDPSLGTYYTYSVSTSDNGTIMLQQDGKDIMDDYFSKGSPLTIITQPDEGYELKSLLINGNDVTASISGNSYTIPSPDCDITVEAVFGLPDYVWLTIRQGIGGETSLKVARDKDVELAFNTDDGWRIHSVTLNGADISGQINLTENLLVLPQLADAAVLNVAFEKDTSGLHEATEESKMHVAAHDGAIHITNLYPDAIVTVYNANGQCVATLRSVDKEAILTDIPSGIYIVTDGTTTVKIAL